MSMNADAIESVAEAIERRGLCEPAIFILELSKPLVGCMRELYGVSEPVASALLGSAWAPKLREVFASSESVEALIQRLERARDQKCVGAA